MLKICNFLKFSGVFLIFSPLRRTTMSSDDKTKDKTLSTSDKDKSKVDLGLLEEDDEFEEFPAEGKSCGITDH